MIEQRVDRLSGGNLIEYVILNQSMMGCAPLHEGALEISPGLRGWISSWWIKIDFIVLSLEESFILGQDIICYEPNIDKVDDHALWEGDVYGIIR